MSKSGHKAFGTVFCDHLSISRFDGESWSAPEIVPTESVSFGVATHALHYGSECFEGMKAHRQSNGEVKAFRPDKNIDRLRNSAERLCLPVPPQELLETLVQMSIDKNRDATPDAPGAMYLRPNLIGTDLNIGAASTPSSTAALYVLASPVGPYLPPHMLRIAIEEELPRTTPQFGRIKCGANYAMALGVIRKSRAEKNTDQVLFAPGGFIEETGAANFLILQEGRIITAPLSDAFLHGITRDSLLQLAASLDWKVEERQVSVSELIELCRDPAIEMALGGTAAILGPVGTILAHGEEYQVGAGTEGPATQKLRSMLQEIQTGKREFSFRKSFS